MSTISPLIEVEGLSIRFPGSEPVRDLSFRVHDSETVALVGESGSGKSLTALALMGLLPRSAQLLSRKFDFRGRNLLAQTPKAWRGIRGRDIAMIFQEPMTSLNPVYTIGDQIVEAITLHQGVGTRRAYEIAEQSLRDVGISDPHRRIHEYPHQMSGGMRQRVMIAMALSCRPRLLIADEPTTALDVTIQAQILELLRTLQRETGMAILLITHDLGVVAENADVVAVMYASRVVEFATVEDLFDKPLHPYTEGLFRSIPRLGDTRSRLDAIPGMVPNPTRFPRGCKFHPRCHRTRALAADQPAGAAGPVPAVPLNYSGSGTIKPGGPDLPSVVEVVAENEKACVMGVCVSTEPGLLEVAPTHWGACHFIDGYDKAPPTTPVSAHQREVRAITIGGGEPPPAASQIPFAAEVSR
jgi:peptide/nickel transport system ATP-binding protein